MKSWLRMWVLIVCWLPAWAAAASCSLLIMGDSLSSGHGLAPGTGWVDLLGARIEKTAPAWHVINASVSGDTTQNGVQRLAPALLRHRPAGVLIALGGNDGLRGIPPSAIRQNLLQMVREAKAAGAWVVLLEAPVLPNYGKPYADAVAALYADVARSEGLARVPCFVCEIGISNDFMQADGIHPNEKAQPRMLDAVWPYIEPRLKCR